MKKSEKIRRKNKLKTVKNYRYLKYAQYACILIIVLFLIYVVGLSSMYHHVNDKYINENAPTRDL